MRTELTNKEQTIQALLEFLKDTAEENVLFAVARKGSFQLR